MFALAVDPTFKSTVEIARAGGKVVPITLEFRHKDTDELDDFLARAEKVKPAEWAAEIICGWEGVDAEFSAENLALLIKRNLSAAEAIMSGYTKGLSGGKLGN